MVADRQNGLEEETRQLIEYKILLTFVLDGNEAAAVPKLNQQKKGSAAFYYARAAVARQHGREAEAAEWLASAAEHFPAATNKLYAESFYEIGWENRSSGETRESFEIVPAEERTARKKASAWTDFTEAQRAFLERRPEAALSLLDRFDETLPGQAASYNLRGEIFMQERKLDDAAATLCKALAADPKLREAAYEFAQIAFKKREYAQARDQLKLLFGETEAAQLIKFEIFLTFLLEGKDSRAQQMMDQFKFTGETPALYYAQAAWAFRHADPERGNGWVDSARRIYSAALNIVFADSFYDLGWLENRPEERTLTTTADHAPELPASSPSWTPGMLLSMNGWSASPAQTLETVTIFPGTVPSFTLLAPPNDPGANQKGAFSTFAPP